MNKYIFLQRKEDLQQLISLKNSFNNISQDELIKKFNREAKIGFTGVHRQALLILALNQQFIKRYNDAPITIENNSILCLKGVIKQIENRIIIYQNN